ncbi:hypothetical protein RhiirC2_799843 [Rhizophagus irregularis]|uniref:Uncharacterized protein n=1 Tax=Rhizophagus irregularis TaxID=588596 RepID=A0A2N1M4F0_9GLOM|nr:hypothetical protein RhiirC2_799843 [Rhizophagus irregularis]
MLLVQKNPRPCPKIINEATRLFSGLVDLDYEPSYDDHIYFQYLSNNKNDIFLLGAYYSKEINSKYIIQVAEKGFIVVDHLFEVYGFSDTYDENLSLRLVLDIDTSEAIKYYNKVILYLEQQEDKFNMKKEEIRCIKKLKKEALKQHFIPVRQMNLNDFINIS